MWVIEPIKQVSVVFFKDVLSTFCFQHSPILWLWSATRVEPRHLSDVPGTENPCVAPVPSRGQAFISTHVRVLLVPLGKQQMGAWMGAWVG